MRYLINIWTVARRECKILYVNRIYFFSMVVFPLLTMVFFTTLMDKCSENGMEYFDFGTSNRPDNNDLNDSLIFQKEGFGARAVCYDTYEWTL